MKGSLVLLCEIYAKVVSQKNTSARVHVQASQPF
jgi:hypothetical protein